MVKNALKQESVVKAAEYLLMGNAGDMLREMDAMFDKQPSLLKYLESLDQVNIKEPVKEVIVRLMTTFFHAANLQKLKIKRIPFANIEAAMVRTAEMRKHFHPDQGELDRVAFQQFYETYEQKEVLNFTYVALSHQFNNFLESEEDGLFIIYSMKAFGDILLQHSA